MTRPALLFLSVLVLAALVIDARPEAIDGVWHHFLIERYRPWMESIAGGG